VSVIERLLGREGPRRGRRDGEDEDGIAIRQMRRRDLRTGTMNVEGSAYPQPWSIGVFQSEIDQMRAGTRHYLVALQDGRIVGHAGVWFTADEAHVTNVAVRPEARRRGIASKLMSAQADEVIRRGCTAWTLEVRVSSTGAQELYRRFGFVPAGVRTKYYENTEDAIVMWCHEIQGDEYGQRLEELRR
jgi:ribosomal-protein-alanine N-acetyltransferase